MVFSPTNESKEQNKFSSKKRMAPRARKAVRRGPSGLACVGDRIVRLAARQLLSCQARAMVQVPSGGPRRLLPRSRPPPLPRVPARAASRREYVGKFAHARLNGRKRRGRGTGPRGLGERASSAGGIPAGIQWHPLADTMASTRPGAGGESLLGNVGGPRCVQPPPPATPCGGVLWRASVQQQAARRRG